jgi:hypothetical protein
MEKKTRRQRYEGMRMPDRRVKKVFSLYWRDMNHKRKDTKNENEGDWMGNVLTLNTGDFFVS